MRVRWAAMAALCAVTIAIPVSLAAQQPVDELLARQTFLSSAEGEPASTIRLDFSAHKGLGMLVPSQMRETFPAEKPGKGSGVATYSNFRRFQTSARIVPPTP